MIRTLTPIFSIVTALLIFFFFSQPRFAEIKQIQDETMQYETAVAKAVELNAELSKKVSEKRAYPAEMVEKLDVFVPSAVNRITMLNDLSYLAESHMMLFGNVAVEVEERVVAAEEPIDMAGMAMYAGMEVDTSIYDEFLTTDVSFSLIGTYEQFKAFLADLEKSLVMFEILSIEFEAGEGLMQQFNVTARTFALPASE